jgi:hypothetical protein
MDIDKQKEFLAKYEELSKEYGMKIVAVPKWVHRDDNSFSLVVDMIIAELKPNA